MRICDGCGSEMCVNVSMGETTWPIPCAEVVAEQEIARLVNDVDQTDYLLSDLVVL